MSPIELSWTAKNGIYVYQRQDTVESDEIVQIWKEAKRAASSAPYTVHQGDGGRLENNCKTWEGERGKSKIFSYW